MVKFKEGNSNLKRTSHSHYSGETSNIFGSLSKGIDLMDGILAECKKHNIRSGMVNCIGSLEKVGYVLFQTKDGYPSGYSNKIEIDAPVELISGTGFICEDENGELDIHLHGLVTEEDGHLSAGHFVSGENPTLITVEFSIIQSENVKALRTFDQNLGFKVINFSK